MFHLRLQFIVAILIFAIKPLLCQYKFQLPVESGYQGKSATLLENSYFRLTNNPYKNESYIEKYDLNSGKLKDRIILKNIVGASCFFPVSENEFWVFDEYELKFHHIINGKIKNSINQSVLSPVPAKGYLNYFSFMNFSPPVYYKDKLYLVNGIARDYETPVASDANHAFINVYSPKYSSLKYAAKIPRSISKYDYGFFGLFSTALCGTNFVIAPQYSNDIMLFNLESGKLTQIKQKNNSKLFNPVTPLNKRFSESELKNFSNEELYRIRLNHYKENSCYIAILYDPTKKCYYRLLQNKLSTATRAYNIIVVVLDEGFNYIKHKELGPKYKFDGAFVSKNGLQLLNHAEYLKNNNVLVFDLIKL